MSSKIKLHKLAMIFVVAVSTLIGPKTAFAAYTCEDVFADTKEFQEKSFEFNHKNIDYRKIKLYDSTLSTDVSGNKSDILIGISEEGHAYLVGEGARLDGNLYGNETRVSLNPRLSPGVVIRIKAVDLDRSALESFHNTYGITCAKTLCSALAKSSGLYVGTKGRTFLAPDTLLNSILKDGIVDQKGNKVPFDIYYLGFEDLPKSMERLQKNTAHLRNHALVPVAIGGAMVSAPVLAFIINALIDDKD